MLKRRVDILYYALTINLHGQILDIAQGNMIYSSIFCKIDMTASKHIISELLQTGLFCQLDQESKGLIVHEILAVVKEDIFIVHGVFEGMGELVESAMMLVRLWFESV